MKASLLAAAVVAVVLPGAPAHAGRPDLAGQFCSFSSIVDPAGDGDRQVGYLEGGPLAAADLPAVDLFDDPTLTWDVLGNPVSVTLTCSIHVGAANMTHAGAAAASASASGVTVVAVPPTPISYVAAVDELVALCTEVVVTDRRGETHHLYREPGTGTFSTDPDSSCAGAVCLSLECGPLGPVMEALDLANRVLVELVDPAVCPQLAAVFPPEGDVDYPVLGGPFWDCPPYGAS